MVDIGGGWDYLSNMSSSAVTVLINQIFIVLGSKEDSIIYVKN
jgi:hypothetical protein